MEKMNITGRRELALRIVLTLLLTPLSMARAQNLIPNGSFEYFTSACGDDGVEYADLENWTYPSCCLPPGLVSACMNDMPWQAGVPNNAAGFQPALDGDSYAGFQTYIHPPSTAPGNNAIDYFLVELIEPLTADQRYCLRLGLNLHDSSAYRTTALHAFFWYGTTSRCAQNDTLWDDYAQITFDITDVDSSEWTILEEDFVANGGETSLTLGAFQFGDEIEATFIQTNAWFNLDAASYWLDDVRLVACDGVGLHEHADGSIISLIGNLVRDELVVRNGDQGAEPFGIYALDGHLIRIGALLPGDNTLDVWGLAEGVYMMHTTNTRQRFVVMR